MIKRTRFEWNVKNLHRNVQVKQIYARIYLKSDKKIIIVSKDGSKRQMPWWKPEEWETFFETLHREINEETSININNYSIIGPIQFWYYYIEENWEKYLQLRYFIGLKNLNSQHLKPNEPNAPDPIKFVQLISIKEVDNRIPWLHNSWEIKAFIKMVNLSKKNILKKAVEKQNFDELFTWKDSKNKRYIDIKDVKNNLKVFLFNRNLNYLYKTWKLENLNTTNIFNNWYSKNDDKIIDNILKKILWISFFEFNNNEKYQQYIRAIFYFRMSKIHTNSINEYKNYILTNDDEKNILIWYISPSTSYFFRDDILSEIQTISQYIKNKNKNINILILWCSTWGEVYSIAYSLKENHIKYNILATDINMYTLEYAKKWKYPESIINTLDNKIVNKLFYKNWIKVWYKSNIEFKTLNILNNKEYPHKYFDLVIVRNTIKYFDEQERHRAFSNIINILWKWWLIMVWSQTWSNKDINPRKYIHCHLVWTYTYKID